MHLESKNLISNCMFAKILCFQINKTIYSVQQSAEFKYRIFKNYLFTCLFNRIYYETFDILSDEEVRQGLKEYSNWPTYPQVYVKGTLIGGLDIVQELDSTGELMTILKDET